MMYCAMTAAEAPMMDTTKPRSNWAIVAFGPWRRGNTKGRRREGKKREGKKRQGKKEEDESWEMEGVG